MTEHDLDDVETLSVIYADLDNLKEINDTEGHAAADQVIEAVEQIGDRVAPEAATFERRYSDGDEFVMTCPELGKQDAEQVAEQFREDVAQAEPQGIEVTTSVGVASYPTDTDEFEDIVDLAEAAMRESKNWGGNHVTLHDIETPYRDIVFSFDQDIDLEQGDQITVKAWRNDNPPELSKLRAEEVYHEEDDRPYRSGSAGTIMTVKKFEKPLTGIVTNVDYGTRKTNFTVKVKEADLDDLPDDRRSYKNFV